MTKLNLPEYPIQIQAKGQHRYVFDEFRKKYVVLTPEEFVRQHFLHYLVNELSYPKSLIKVESGLKYNQMSKRSDIIVFDRQARPLLLVECKSTKVPLDGKVFDQLSVYNQSVKAKYLVITNGLKHFCCRLDYQSQSYSFIPEIPSFGSIYST